MTIPEFQDINRIKSILINLARNYGRAEKDIEPYINYVKDISIDILRSACDSIIMSDKHFPRVNRILEACKKLSTNWQQSDNGQFHGERSYAWAEYSAILSGVRLTNPNRLVSVAIPDMNAMHFYTRWLQDCEIDEINRRRRDNGINSDIFRVAYHGNGKYTNVSAWREMIEIERTVDDGIKCNLAKIFARITSGKGIQKINGKFMPSNMEMEVG